MGAFVGTAERAGGGRDGAPRRWARCRAGPRLGRLGRGLGGAGSEAGGGPRGGRRGGHWRRSSAVGGPGGGAPGGGEGTGGGVGAGVPAGVLAGVRGLKKEQGCGWKCEGRRGMPRVGELLREASGRSGAMRRARRWGPLAEGPCDSSPPPGRPPVPRAAGSPACLEPSRPALPPVA